MGACMQNGCMHTAGDGWMFSGEAGGWIGENTNLQSAWSQILTLFFINCELE